MSRKSAIKGDSSASSSNKRVSFSEHEEVYEEETEYFEVFSDPTHAIDLTDQCYDAELGLHGLPEIFDSSELYGRDSSFQLDDLLREQPLDQYLDFDDEDDENDEENPPNIELLKEEESNNGLEEEEEEKERKSLLTICLGALGLAAAFAALAMLFCGRGRSAIDEDDVAGAVVIGKDGGAGGTSGDPGGVEGGGSGQGGPNSNGNMTVTTIP